MRFAPSSLASRILVGFLAIVVVTVGLGFLLFLTEVRSSEDDAATQRAASIATTVALTPGLASLIADGDPGGAIQTLAEGVRKDAGAAYVVVIGADGRRWSHPNTALIGVRIEEPVVALDGTVHLGMNNGTLGRSANARAPLRDNAGHVVGEVSVGILESQVSTRVAQAVPGLLGYTAIALAVGSLFALALAQVLKRVTFGLEPAAIAALMQEREAMLHGIREGLLATDVAGRITVLNDEGRRLLGVGAAEPGRRLTDVLPPGRLRDILTGAVPGQDVTLVQDDHVLTLNRRPVAVGGRSIGAVVTVRDRSESEALLRHVDSVEAVTSALRASQHEYRNRLHALAVLLELGEVEEATAYARELLGEVDEGSREILSRVGSPLVASLLVAKTTLAHERGVSLTLDTESRLDPSGIDVPTVLTTLGNLLDNAIDAASAGPLSAGARAAVDVTLLDAPDGLRITVRDNGPGIPTAAVDAIFDDGWTTKAPDGLLRRGVGLALVRRVLTESGGHIRVHNDGGAVFDAVVPRHPTEVPA